ncbi:MFS transporter [Alicyclobacillus sp. ALC3]|uniref:MFS transporter n=1 Tax=Alicyclobacillus sp. ALC3 TaxID=2796143 RepID=UPI0023786030|nr:MFS transporter [Alicyclobacillus sp. ALC3]WDL97750.1 MFS transporter [Alicyclobacillus sp. ALC3]
MSLVYERTSEVPTEVGRQALIAAFLAFFVDMFDVFLPVVALAPAMSYFLPKTVAPTTETTMTFLVFAFSLIGRPLGAFIFGHYGDKTGRKRITLVATLGCTVATFLMAFLPGYKVWGVTGIILLAILRFVDGIFLGGEYTGANPLAMEYTAKHKRGMYGGLINTGYPAASVAMSIITVVLLSVMSSAGPNSPYAVWGWRIPFVAGAAFSFVLFIYYLRKVEESRAWKPTKESAYPLKQLFRGQPLRRLMIVFIVMSGIWFQSNGFLTAYPSILGKILGVGHGVITWSQLLSGIVLLFLFTLVGVISQKIGRNKVVSIFGIIGVTIAPLLYYVLVNGGYKHTAELIVLVLVLNALMVPIFGLLTSWITEMFHTSIRASGYGVGYSLAILIPSFSSFFMLDLAKLMPYKDTGIAITAFGGLLILIGGILSPDTRHVDFNDQDA